VLTYDNIPHKTGPLLSPFWLRRIRLPDLKGPISALSLGTQKEVRAVCRQTIADASGCRHFLGSSTEPHWDIKLKNAIAMFESAWETEL